MLCTAGRRTHACRQAFGSWLRRAARAAWAHGSCALSLAQEVRWDPAVHAYLQAASDDEWRECYTGGSLRNKCWRDDGLVTR